MPRVSLRFALLLAACFNLAGQSAGSRQLSVVVVNAAAKPHKPVAGARVALQRSLTDTRITAGVMPSDRNGRVVFDLPSSFQLAFDIRLEVTDSGDLVLYKPEEGA